MTPFGIFALEYVHDHIIVNSWLESFAHYFSTVRPARPLRADGTPNMPMREFTCDLNIEVRTRVVDGGLGGSAPQRGRGALPREGAEPAQPRPGREGGRNTVRREPSERPSGESGATPIDAPVDIRRLPDA